MDMSTFVNSLLGGLFSGALLSFLVRYVLLEKITTLESEIKAQFERAIHVFQSKREWKERSVSELLGPLYMQFERTRLGFERWRSQNIYLEGKVIRDGNQTIRNLILEKADLIPPDLLADAAKLVEHYDLWLEKFETKRLTENPDLETAFIFTGPDGYPFPRLSEKRFKDTFKGLWNELYETST